MFKGVKELINDGTVILFKWKYPYRLPNSGTSGQTTQQTHSLWAFRNCKYIGLLDVDEYVNFKFGKTIDEALNIIIQQNKIDVPSISSFRFKNRVFYNPRGLDSSGFKFLNIPNCSQGFYRGKEKNFIIPRNCETICVHRVTLGKKMYEIDSKYGFFNHYYYMNKTKRGREATNIKDSSISRLFSNEDIDYYSNFL
jgi:hypothetical protein